MPTFAEIRASRRARRAPSRPLLSNGKRQYAAAKVTRYTGDWLPVDANVNDLTRSSSRQIRARVRQLVRDFPYFARAVNVLVAYTVGTGMSFQSRVLNPRWQPGSSEPKFDRAARQKIEDAVAWWMDEADAAGRLHFSELEQLASREEAEAGEFLFIKRAIKSRNRYIPYALQAIEADWLTDVGASPAGKNLVDQGIEYDSTTGRVVAYHLTDPDGWGKTIRVQAEHVIHGFAPLRSGQLRGVSPFHTAVLIAHDLNDYLDATIDTAKLAAKYLALVTTADPGGFQSVRTQSGTGDDQGKKIEELEGAIIEYLRPGEQIEFAKNDNPSQTFDPFTKFVLRMLAVATGVSYPLLSGDYSKTSWSTMRVERNDLGRVFAVRQARHIRQFSNPAVRDAIEQAVLAGKLDLPGYFANPRHYQRCVWIPPGMEPVDPLRESKANRDDIAATLRTPQEICAARGRDYEEVLDELAEARQLAQDRGLGIDTGSTVLANNPAALGATDRQLEELLMEDIDA